jgi:hypothetical protein
VELVRVSRDAYGQRVLEGASWDLLPWFAGAAVAIAVAHAAYMAARAVVRRAGRR